MHIIGLSVLILALAIGIMLLILIKPPELTSKKNIIEAILGVHDTLFSYRREIRSLIGDNLRLYNQHDKVVLSARYRSLNLRKQEISQKLANAKNNLAAYKKVNAQKQFYDLATATIDTLEQALNSLGELQNGSTTFEPVVAKLQQISTLIRGTDMTTHVSGDDKAAVKRVAEHIAAITGLIKQTTEQIATLSLQRNEFQTIAQSTSAALEQAEQDYMELRGLLSSGQYETYMSKNHSLPDFFARFDVSGYESLATAIFDHNAEESFINDLRTHLYS